MKKIWSHVNSDLQKSLQKQRLLQQKIHYHLPEEFREKVHCHLAAGYLKIYACNSTWASKIRYQQQQILKSVMSDPELNVQKVKILVETGLRDKTETLINQPVEISTEARRSLEESAAATSDPELKAAFMRLANLPNKQQ